MIERNDYISIVIPAFNRYEYLEEVIKSIYEHADYPFELIVHDDASNKEVSDKIYTNLRSFISTYILNPNIGWNMGLAMSVDRCVSLATSNYILMLNADCKVIAPCFKRIKDVLDVEFIGFITPHEDNDFSSWFENNGTEFIIQHGVGGGCVQSFRKSVWKEVGGWAGEDEPWSGSADTNFVGKIYKQGYFRASINGKNCFYNMSLLDKGNQDSTIGNTHDCSLPKINKFELVGKNFESESNSRYGHIDHYKHSIEKVPRASNNSEYWHKATSTILPNFPNFNWELAEQYQFTRFKDSINSQKLYSK